jgi:hypothetical protein
MSDFVWLDMPIHKNRFKGIDFDKLTTLQMSFDGSIMSVKRECVESHYIENDVQMIKTGYKKMPNDLKVETEDDLYKFLAYYISL